ncbi:unnamed protein product [Mytilus coruscus]|uniref:Uncharacterized protein n=1 Tax=Mytilus coruscus TaxID=42192 RepID=A0A6J8ECX8_MYTCO|nr:unnamed protein product [Mytilus coruscus]
MMPISQEEENNARIYLLLSGISERAVRALFDKEFDPSFLYLSLKKEINNLNDLKENRTLNQSQWRLLFPINCKPQSSKFDVTLMTTLLTNLANFSLYKKFPLLTDTSISADLARIRYYRNYISHESLKEGETINFTEAWDDISSAVRRLGGKQMHDECIDLKTKCLDRSTVPWNIRVQINQILAEWRMNNSNFVETRAAKYVLERLHENSCVTITAASGVGKTSILRYVALGMKDGGYDLLLVTSPHDIVKYHNPNKKTLFVIDDFCGIFTINQSYLDNCEIVLDRIKILVQNKLTKIIVACRLQVYKDEKFASLSIFRTCVCNLQSDDLCLLQTEKQMIAELYLETKASTIIQYCDLYDCFPLLCKLYSENTGLNISDFFKNPFLVYEAEIDKLCKVDFGKYCALALCVMFNNTLKEEWFTGEIDKEIRKRIKNICEECKLERGTSRLLLLDKMKTLEHSFLKKENDIYKLYMINCLTSWYIILDKR